MWSDQLLPETSGADRYNRSCTGFIGSLHWFPVAMIGSQDSQKVDRSFQEPYTEHTQEGTGKERWLYPRSSLAQGAPSADSSDDFFRGVRGVPTYPAARRVQQTKNWAANKPELSKILFLKLLGGQNVALYASLQPEVRSFLFVFPVKWAFTCDNDELCFMHLDH